MTILAINGFRRVVEPAARLVAWAIADAVCDALCRRVTAALKG